MWRVLSIAGSGENVDTSETFGHTFKLRIVLEHNPMSAGALMQAGTVAGLGGAGLFNAAQLKSMVGAPKEPPDLVWNEKICFLDHQKKTFWNWSGDLYLFKRTARTFKAWVSRYYEAYNTAMGQRTDPLALRGRVELLDERDIPIPAQRITRLYGKPIPQGTGDGGGEITDAQKAEVIRRFISRNICRLVVEIHDRPGIHVSKNQDNFKALDKERLLLFDCGVGGQRVRASQYLKVKGSAPKGNWERSFEMHWSRTDLPSHGYVRGFPPTDLYTFAPGQMLAGESGQLIDHYQLDSASSSIAQPSGAWKGIHSREMKYLAHRWVYPFR